jgi:hypothetical protein
MVKPDGFRRGEYVDAFKERARRRLTQVRTSHHSHSVPVV